MQEEEGGGREKSSGLGEEGETTKHNTTLLPTTHEMRMS